MEKECQLLIAKDAMTVAFHSVKITWWVEPEDQQADIPGGIMANPQSPRIGSEENSLLNNIATAEIAAAKVGSKIKAWLRKLGH